MKPIPLPPRHEAPLTRQDGTRIPGPERAPASFCADVQAAAASHQTGLLALLRQEVSLYPWAADAAHTIDQAIATNIAPADAQFSYDHAILFTGHRIDDPGRQQPRFPASREAVARTAIEHALGLLLRKGERAVGLAGGASGGDLLFHELCAERSIPSLLRLSVPPEIYLPLSVAPAGPAWEHRFAALLSRLSSDDVHTLSRTPALPPWMGEPHRTTTYDPWQRTNLWLLQDALALAPRRSLLALWDGEPGDAGGGTEHMLRMAEANPGFCVQVVPVPCE